MPLFYNKHFLINSKNILIEEFYNRDIRLVKDMMDVNENCLTLENIESIMGNLCNFCLTQEETLNHLFLECEQVKPLIQNLKLNINEIYPNLEMSSIHILLGCDKNYV